MNFDHYLFRCFALGHLMSEEKGKSNEDVYQSERSKLSQLLGELETMPKLTKKNEVSLKYTNKESAVEKQLKITKSAELTRYDITLSSGAKTHLMDIYIREKTGR